MLFYCLAVRLCCFALVFPLFYMRRSSGFTVRSRTMSVCFSRGSRTSLALAPCLLVLASWLGAPPASPQTEAAPWWLSLSHRGISVGPLRFLSRAFPAHPVVMMDGWRAPRWGQMSRNCGNHHSHLPQPPRPRKIQLAQARPSFQVFHLFTLGKGEAQGPPLMDASLQSR